MQHEISVLKENISVLTDITYKIHVAHPDADKRAIDKTVKDLKQRLPRLNNLLSDRLSKLQLALKQVCRHSVTRLFFARSSRWTV